MFNRAPAVDVAQAQALLADGATLLDVRRADEWHAGHAPDAMHIPLDALPNRVDDVPAHHRVIAVCRSGARSGRATMYLRGFGLDVVNLAGGMQAWARAGGEIVSDRGGRGHVT